MITVARYILGKKSKNWDNLPVKSKDNITKMLEVANSIQLYKDSDDLYHLRFNAGNHLEVSIVYKQKKDIEVIEFLNGRTVSIITYSKPDDDHPLNDLVVKLLERLR